MSNTNKSAAPARALSATSLLLAAVIALEVTGMHAPSKTGTGALAAAAADGDTIYAPADRSPASGTDVLAQAGY
ncbi:MAG: hypothetical protein JF586_18345 [Burkholderiales bacterium]|nr:hypothetical protein [Burkholderiales bacterium]